MFYRTGDLYLHDVRIADHLIANLEGHTQEICGMAWSPESNCHTLATGANDNLVKIWDDRNTSSPVHSFNDHQAAIKAVAFCPWQPRTLATGGGTADRNIRFWNLSTGNLINSIDTGSQVRRVHKSCLLYEVFSNCLPVISKYTDYFPCEI